MSRTVARRHAAQEGLTSEQLRFAREHRTTSDLPAGRGPGLVFLYRDEPWSTYRWLVDPSGRVLDFAALRRSPPPSPRRFVRRPGGSLSVGDERFPSWPAPPALLVRR
jgi:hypothetical protein